MIVGIVGAPNKGKSTFFKSATLADAAIGNYPFTTIEPNEGIGYVRVPCIDKELNTQCTPREGFCVNHIRYVPIKLLDVAGLVPDAHKGKGMGNEFLDDLSQADVLIHVIDVSGSTNEKGEVVQALSHDPAGDIKFLEIELDMWYLRILKKGWEKFARKIQQEKANLVKEMAKQLSGLKVTEDMVKEVIARLNIDPTTWSEQDLFHIAQKLRLKTKPMIIAANKIDIRGAEQLLEKIKNEFKNYAIIPCSAESELALREAAKKELITYYPGDTSFVIKVQLNDKQTAALEFIKKNVLETQGSTGVQVCLDKAIFDVLKYIAIFPGGLNKLEDKEGRRLPDCFLLPNRSTALDFAFKVHTDLGKNFVKAIDVKTKKVVGKDHVLQHRDLIEIKTSA